MACSIFICTRHLVDAQRCDLVSDNPCPMSHGGFKSLWHLDDDLHQTNIVTKQAKQGDLIMVMKSPFQNPLLGEFCFQDMVWRDRVTRKGKYKTSLLVVIYWDRLHDFIQGEQHHPLYPYKYTKESIRWEA